MCYGTDQQPFTDLCLLSNTVAPLEPSSTKVRADTPGPKRTSISSDAASHSHGRSTLSLPPQKQHLAELPPLVSEHPLHTISQQLAPCTIWRNAHPYMGPHCSFEHHDFISYCAAFRRERLSATRIDRRQHHTVEELLSRFDTSCQGPTYSCSDAARVAISHRHFLETQPATPHIMPLC